MWWTPWLWSLRMPATLRHPRERELRIFERDLIGSPALDGSRSDSRTRLRAPRPLRLALAGALVALVVAAAPAAARPPGRPVGARPFLLGVNAGYWGASEPRDLRRVATVVRLTNPPRLTRWERAGLRVIADFSGPYTHAGVIALDHAAYVEKVVAFVRANPHVYAVEVLNEPGGNWFWGSEAESQQNRDSYAQLLVEVHEALARDFGGRRPLELASWDGGHDSSNAWGEAWSHNATALADVDAVTNHPYGGRGSRAQAILGNRSLIEGDEAVSHKPIYITEVGFPTGNNYSDSLLYSESEQAFAIGSFASWARQTGYIAGVTFYGYRDAHEGGGYGIETHHGRHKPAFAVLASLRRR
jgi:hypothetical protein